MGPYSVDLRERVVAAYLAGEGTMRELAEIFRITKNTVQNWMNLLRETGDVEPRPHGGGVSAVIAGERLETLRALVAEDNDATLDELHLALERRCHVATSRAAVSRALKAAKITRKEDAPRGGAGAPRRR